ncbi:MAG: MFS transporter [Actinomycetota bacterium]|nr:MFS transporter [Actinomycetota bacterium]
MPFLLRSALLTALLVLAFFGMHDIGFRPRPVTLRTMPAEARAVATAGIRHGWGVRSLRLIMIAGAVQSGFFFWAWYAWQPYFLELLDRDAVWVAGVVTALLSVAMIVGNILVRLFTRFCGRRTTILLWTAFVFAGASIGVGWARDSPVALGFLIVASIAMGVQMPVRQTLIHAMVPSAERATVVSFDSLAAGVGSVAGQAGLGVYSERQGYSAAYVIGGAVTLLAVPVVWTARRMKAPADYLEGTASAEFGACVPKGFPSIVGESARVLRERLEKTKASPTNLETRTSPP